MFLPGQGHGAQQFASSTSHAQVPLADLRVSELLHNLGAELDMPVAEGSCLTPLLLEGHRQNNRLSPRVEAEFNRLTGASTALAGPQWEPKRPFSMGQYQSATHPLTVHYRLRSQRELAEQVLHIAEYSWDLLLDMGFYPPIPDEGQGGNANLDIYLSTEARTGGGAYTATTNDDSDPTDDLQSCYSYIAIYEGLDLAEEVPVFVAHELAHAFQAAMDYQEGTFFWESTGVAIEDIAFGDIDDYHSFVDNFQRYPHYGLNETTGSYPYGGVVFAQFLDEVLGDGDGQIIGQLWQETAQGNEINEPDYLDTIQAMAQDGGLGNLSQTLSLFSGWRYFVAEWDDGHHLSEASVWPSNAKVTINANLMATELPFFDLSSDVETEALIHDLGSNYFSLETEGYGGNGVALELDGDPDTKWALTAIHWYPDRPGEITHLGESDAQGDISAVVDILGAERLVFAVINAGRPAFDADDESETRTYSLDILAL